MAVGTVVGQWLCHMQNLKTDCVKFRSLQGDADIDIFRVGSNEATVSVSWATEDGTAMAGKHFLQSFGTVQFLPVGLHVPHVRAAHLTFCFLTHSVASNPP